MYPSGFDFIDGNFSILSQFFFFIFFILFIFRSHCVCDDMLYDCLKKLNDTPAAQVMGTIYFNIVQVFSFCS